MTLEDFEKSLAIEREAREKHRGTDEDHKSKRRKHDYHHHHSRDEETPRRHKHRHRDRTHETEKRSHHRDWRPDSQGSAKSIVTEAQSGNGNHTENSSGLQRDSWMEAPSALDVEIVHRKAHREDESTSSFVPSSKINTQTSDNLQDSDLGVARPQDLNNEPAFREPVQHIVSYSFGDAGAQWRMTKLKAVYRHANEVGRPVDEVAIERFGDLRTFDEAREEETELERRKTYGQDYVGKTKPSGDLFQERMLNVGTRRETSSGAREGTKIRASASAGGQHNSSLQEVPEAPPKPLIDQTALNKLKARMMKAKLKGSVEAKILEKEYEEAESSLSNQKPPNTIVLGAMENPMLAGGRDREVKAVKNKRGRERGKVEEKEDMTINDMVREERRNRGQAGGSGRQMAERIAKDQKFDVSAIF